MLDEVVIDIMFNGSVDVLRYAQGELHNGENILRKRVPRLSYSNYRHAKHGGRQGNYGWVVFIYSNYFRNIAEGATVVKDTLCFERVYIQSF
jgi:hypothetical protein